MAIYGPYPNGLPHQTSRSRFTLVASSLRQGFRAGDISQWAFVVKNMEIWPTKTRDDLTKNWRSF